MSDIFEEPAAEEPQQEVEQEGAPQETETTADTVEVKQDSTVPTAALNESRAQLRQTQSELQSLKNQFAQFEQLKQELEEHRQQAQQSQQDVEFNADPLGTMQQQLKSLHEKFEQTTTSQQQTQEQQLQQQQQFQAVASQVADFKKSNPQYDDALNYVMDARRKELAIMGVAESQMQQAIDAEAQALAESALRNGQNPAELVWNMAQVRGFVAKKSEEKVDQIQKGQKSASTLSDTSGSPNDDLSLSEIDKMTDEQFDKYWEENMKVH